MRDANNAARLLNDQFLMDTLAQIEAEYLDTWRQGDVPEGVSLFWQLRAVDDLRKNLRVKFDRGTVEGDRLDRDRGNDA